MTTTLLSAHGRYLCAEHDGRVVADRTIAGPWEHWTIEEITGEKVALKSDHGHYLCAEPDGRVVCDRTVLGVYESWTPCPSSEGYGGLLSYHGRYLCAEPETGKVIADRPVCGPWETWGSSLFATPIPPARTGRVRLNGKAMSDDGGSYLALGSSLFWAVRGARGEPERMRQNALWLREQGCDFVRVLGETTDWPDATKTDPRWPDYRTALRTCRDICTALGLRVQWSVFGGNQLSFAEQGKCVDDVLTVCEEAPDTVQYVEISNEGNGFRDADGRSRMHRYAQRFRDHGYIVALTSAAHGDGMYTMSPANLATVHFDRNMNENGWRPVRQPWGYPGEYEPVPVAFASGEPVGPGSSVCADYDPLRLGMNAVHTWMLGGAAHVVHSGSGIFGVDTSHPVGGQRPANVWDQQGLEGALQCVTALRQVLPADLPNWQRTRHSFSDHPFTFPPDPLVTVGDGALATGKGCVRGYAAHRDGRYVCAPIGVMYQSRLQPLHAANWTEHDGLTGTPTRQGTGTLIIDELMNGRAVLITGDYR